MADNNDPRTPGYESLPPPPATPGSHEPPHHHGADPWAFDHDANQPAAWGSAHMSTAPGWGVRYSSTPMHQPASKKPLVVFLVIVVVLALIGGVAAWYFLRDPGRDLLTVGEPQTLSLNEYVDEICGLYARVGEESVTIHEAIADRVLSVGDGLHLPKAELLDFSQQLLYDLSDAARWIATEVWELNETYVIDHPQGATLRDADRAYLVTVFDDLDDIDTEIGDLAVDLSDAAIGQEFERIVNKIDALFDDDDAGSDGLAGVVNAEVERRGEACAVPQ